MKNLRWGILGTASIADAVINGIKSAGAGTVSAVASRSEAKAKKWAGQRSIPNHFGSYREMLESGEIDVVYNPLPNSLHAEWTIAALEAGLPVLCEKPIALNTEQAKQIADKSRATGIPVAEAFMYRFHPIFDRIKAELASGSVGKLSTMESCFTFRMDEPDAIPASAALGGGSLMDVGCYCVNFFRLITGAEPLRVSAIERRTDVDASMVGLLEFPNGVLARFESSIENYERHHCALAGETGAIILEKPWFPGVEQSSFFLEKDQKRQRILQAGADGYALEAFDFAEAVTKGRPPKWTIDDAVKNMIVIDTLFQAAREGRTINL